MKNRLLMMVALLLFGCSSQQVVKTDVAAGNSPAELNAQLGLEYMQAGNAVLAEKKLKKAMMFDASLDSPYLYLAELYKRQNILNVAEKFYLRGLKNATNKAALNNHYGAFLCAQKRVREAEKHLSKAGKDVAYSQRDVAYENAALCLMSDNNFLRAEKYLHKALVINPRRLHTLYLLAQLSYKREAYQDAQDFLQRMGSLSYQPSPASLLLEMRVARQLGDKDGSNRFAATLRKRFPDSNEVKMLGQAAP